MSGTGRAPETNDSEAATPAGRAVTAWRAAETILRAVTGRSDLTGQALVGEARRTERLTLGDAHVLVALHGWMERQRDPAFVGSHEPAPPTEGERSVAREAMLALEHAVATVQREVPRDGARDATSDFTVSGTRRSSSFAPPDSTSTAGSANTSTVGAAGAGAFAGAAASAGGSQSWNAPRSTGAAAEQARRAGSTDTVGTLPLDEPGPAQRRRVFGSPAFLIGAAALLLLLIAGGAWYALEGRKGAAYEEGTAAYARGSREAARLAFAKAATDDPDDARPLIFLGRIAREEGDLPRARRFLDRAVRLAPNSAIALREMASTMLAEGNPDLARRFYVRALEIDPSDRLAQGFLACALHRLGRVEDARRFVERAGTGEWTACLSGPVMPPMPPGIVPPGMMPPGLTPPPPPGSIPPR